jgi:putative nucleotidyltransferase with HDIG domain
MSTEFDPAVEALLAENGSRAAAPPPRRELLSEVAAGVGLVVACLVMAVLLPEGESWHPAVIAGLVIAYAVVGRVTFDVGAGYTTPTQLVLVAILFAVPPAAVPLLVAAGAVLRRMPDVLGSQRVHPLRIFVTLPDAWHAVGPALVIGIAGLTDPSLSDWPVYAAAFAAQIAFDTGTSMLRVWLALGVRPSMQLRILGLVVAVDAALAPIGFVIAVTMASAPTVLLAVLPLAMLLGHLAREREQRIHNAIELSSAYRGTAMLMSDVLVADDAYTGGEHTLGVVDLSLEVGRELGMDALGLRNLEFGALLHDVGKINVPKEIINKPGRLTEEEWKIIQRHPVDGQQMLDRVGGRLSQVGRIVRTHHERVDGTGYPDGLRGDEIPLEARIISACDAYSAMTTTRSYRAAMPSSDAMTEIVRCAGAQFDAAVVAALVRVMARQQAPGPAPPLALAA